MSETEIQFMEKCETEEAKKKLKDRKARHWAVTIWKDPSEVLDNLTSGSDHFRYAICGVEYCPTTSRKHWQSYFEFHQPVRKAYIIRCLDDKKIKCGVRYATRDQARNYCMKDNNFKEWGVWNKLGQGFRSDLDSVCKTLVDGTKSLRTVMEERPALYCKYRNGFKDLAHLGTMKKSSAFREVKVVIHTGPTGTGKTRRAMENVTYKTEGYSMNWWCSYNADKKILIDDYSNDVKCVRMLHILDGYRLELPVKGGKTFANWDEVHITTNLRLNELHPNAKDAHRRSFFRRVDMVVSDWPEDKERRIMVNNEEIWDAGRCSASNRGDALHFARDGQTHLLD